MYIIGNSITLYCYCYTVTLLPSGLDFFSSNIYGFISDENPLPKTTAGFITFSD